ncbi:MAG: hypothetical protein AB8F78_08930 [Saprospiraceae bacterium]
MALLAQLGLYVLAGLLVAAGISHFLRPGFYTRMLPLWLPAHKFLVALSGGIEIILGLALLYPPTQVIAAWATIAMLTSFLIVHFYMVSDREAGLGLPKWALWLRILLQFVLMGWVFLYTQ